MKSLWQQKVETYESIVIIWAAYHLKVTVVRIWKELNICQPVRMWRKLC